jgi:hypothetical protein
MPNFQGRRIDAIDFWRGVALAFILINHMPGNVLSAFTLRNFAFSDSAEIFVFLAGVSVDLGYGARVARGEGRAATFALLRRACRLYGAHLGLTAAALAFFGLATALTAHDLLLVEDGGRLEPFVAPMAGGLGLLALTHQLPYFNILPLYVLLITAAPLLLFLAARDRITAIAASLTIYAGARAAGLNLPAWPGHNGWYFNPFTWQLMFVLGICGGGLLRKGGVPYSRPLDRACRLVSIAAALIVSNGFGLMPGLVDAVGRYLDWDKTDLGAARVLNFLALAYCVYFSSFAAWLKRTRAYRFFCRLGCNALTTFCFGSLLSAIGQAARPALEANGGAAAIFDVFFVAVALIALHDLACRVDRGRTRRAPAAATGRPEMAMASKA